MIPVIRSDREETFVELPASLPARLYLLAYDPYRRRLTAGARLGFVLRAAALADLHLDGRVTDADGRARPEPGGAPGPGARRLGPDPVVDRVLKQLTAATRPRRWQHWIRSDAQTIQREVRDQLEDGGWIRVELRRPFWIISRTKITVRDPGVVKRLIAEVTRTLHGAEPSSRVPARRAALAALAAAGELPTVCPRRVRRAHRDRIAGLSGCCGPVVPALHKVVQQHRSGAAAG